MHMNITLERVIGCNGLNQKQRSEDMAEKPKTTTEIRLEELAELMGYWYMIRNGIRIKPKTKEET